MINTTLSPAFLKDGECLTKAIHLAIEDTIDAVYQCYGILNRNEIFEYPTRHKLYLPTRFIVAFTNYKTYDSGFFTKKWVEHVFELTTERNDNPAINKRVLPDVGLQKFTKTDYRGIRQTYRMLMYALWNRKALLLPFNYSMPRVKVERKVVSFPMMLYPETLRIIVNIFLDDPQYERNQAIRKLNLNNSYIKNLGYKTLVATDWFRIEDINIAEVQEFKEWYCNLFYQDDNGVDYIATNSIARTLPFNDMLKVMQAYDPNRCTFSLSDIQSINLKQNRETEADKKEKYIPDKFKFNLSNKLKFIAREHSLASSANQVLMNCFDTLVWRHHNRYGIDYKKVRNKVDFTTPRLCFIWIMTKIKTIDRQVLVRLFEIQREDYLEAYEIDDLVGEEGKTGFWTIQHSDEFKWAIKSYFVLLACQSIVLLPRTFKRPKLGQNDFASVFYSNLYKSLLSNVSDSANGNDLSHNEKENRTYLSLILSTTWQEPEDINVNDVYILQVATNEWSRTRKDLRSINIIGFLRRVHAGFPELCKFDPKHISITLAAELSSVAVDDTEAVNKGHKWIHYLNQYIELKKAQGLRGIEDTKRCISRLIRHITVTLPLELGENNSKIPFKPKDLRRVHFKGSWTVPSLKDELKREFKAERYNTYLRDISTFLEWLELEDQDADVVGVKNIIHKLDYRKTSRRKGTSKKAFPKKQFSRVYSMMTALSEFYWYLISNDKFIVNGVGNNHIYKAEDVGFVPIIWYKKKYYPIHFIPAKLTGEISSIRGGEQYSYPIFQSLFACLIALETGLRNIHIRWIDVEKFDAPITKVKNAKNDKANTSQSRKRDIPISPLQVHYIDVGGSNNIEVGTDKVKTEPWTPYVSNRVINLLKRLRAFQNQLDIEVPSQWYDYHEENVHGKIRSAFNLLHATSEEPVVVTWEQCTKSYKRVQYLHDVLVEVNDWDDWIHLGELPEKVDAFISSSKVQLRDTLIDKGIMENSNEYSVLHRQHMLECIELAFRTVNAYSTEFTPHGARATVASDRVKALPPSAIGEHITGHESNAVLAYYVQVDPDWFEEIAEFNDALIALGIKTDKDHALSHINSSDNDLRALKEAVERDPSSLTDFGALSFTTETSPNVYEGGLNSLSLPTSNPALMSTHICPFNGVCPDEIKKELGEYSCGQCYYSVKTVDNMPRILGHIRSLNDKLNEKIAHILDASNGGANNDALELLEVEKDKIGDELSAWTITYDLLDSNLNELKERSSQLYFVQRPNMLLKNFESGVASNNPISELMLRISDADSFREYFTPQLKARIIKLRKQILVKHKQFDLLLQEPDGFELIDEFRGIIRAFAETHKVSLDDALKSLSEPLKQPSRGIKLLREANDG